MARVRSLSPGFFTDERVVSVSMPARLLFAGLWTEADREGRLEDKALVLKMRLFPADQVDVKALLDELDDAGLVNRYSVAGRAYLLVPKFKEHQHVHPKEAPSKLPGPSVSPGKSLMHEAKARENTPCMTAEPCNSREDASCMTVEPGKKPHEEGVSPSDVQAFGYSGLQAFGFKIAGERPPAPSKPKKPKVEKASDPRHTPTLKALVAVFEELRPSSYPFHKRDLRALTSMLETMDPEAISAAWRRALLHQGFPMVASIFELSTNLGHFVTDRAPNVVDIRKPVAPATFTESKIVGDF